MEENENEQEQKGLVKNASNKISNVGKEEAKKAVKKSVKKAVTKGAAQKSLLAAFAPVITIVAIVIFVIVIATGIIVFFITLPGMAMDSIKQFAKDVGNSIASYFGRDEVTYVEDEKIYEVLDYMEDMGYDLKGYGFLTDYVDKDDEGNLLDDEDDGVKRYNTDDEKDGKIKEAESDYIFTYLVSDNYMYTVKNFNLDTQDGDGTHWYEKLWTTVKGIGARTFGRIISNLTLGIVNNFEGELWGKGMIAIYYDNGLGVQGDFYGNGLRNNWRNIFKWPPEWPLEFNSIKMDAEKKTLTIQKGVLGDKIEYNMEGWTGRYGMPLEFLLAVHLGTMMPDLAFDMAETFPTEVQILLHRKTGDTDTYVPYISKVINHWYRDTYFVMQDSMDVVQIDKGYEDLRKERWTLYETYEDGPRSGEFKLYLMDSKGQYATSTSDIRNYADASSKIVQDSGNGYYLFDGTQEEANDLGLAVVKKAKLIKYSNSEFDDIGWNNSGNIWTAYELKDNGAIEQTGEGLRTETNPTIKQMFLYNTYFRYDGTQEVAEAINKLRKENNIELGALNYKYNLDEDDSVLKNTKTTLSYDNGETKEYSIEDVSGKVLLNQDSMNVFSMFENIHTLDTDYIYRDFKELAVEFGYFTKEELTEEKARLLAWPIYDTGSYGYPKREVDKNDYEFGTMIHSKGDVETIKNQGLSSVITAIQEKLEQDEEDMRPVEIPSDNENEVENDNNMASLSAGTSDLIENASLGVHVDVGHVVYTESHAEPNKRHIEHVASPETADEGYIDIIQDGCVEYKHYLQSSGPYASNAYAGGTMSNSGCGPTSVTNLLTGYGIDVTPEDVRAFAEQAGDSACNPTPQLDHFGLEHDVYMGISKKELVDLLIEAFNEGKPVVALMPPPQPDTDDFWTKVGHYACLIGIDEEGKMITADPASMNELRISCPNGVDDIGEYLLALWIPKEPPSGFKKEGKPYTGYLGNEPVVSPVTGILLEYGTYGDEQGVGNDEDERINVDLKYGNSLIKTEDSAGIEVEDKVGYAKIMVLDAENYRKLEARSGSYWADDRKTLVQKEGKKVKYRDEESLKEVKNLKNDDKWTTLNKTVYGYKEFAEKYDYEGIAGDIIYIDGFTCEDVDEDLENSLGKKRDKVAKEIPNGDSIKIDDFKVDKSELDNEDALRPSQYEMEQSYQSFSQKDSDRMKAENKVKKDAASSILVDDNGKDLIFIKEGTVLGRTITDKELLESDKYRKCQYGTYEEMRETKDEDGNLIRHVIGNYLRMVFRSTDDSVIEDVEDYIKLDEGTDKKKIEIDDFELYYWSPYEAGGWDKPKCGPEQAEDHKNGTSEISTGICQWTNDTKENKEIYKVISYAGQYDSKYSGMESLRGTLQGVPGSVSAASAVAEMQNVITGYCNSDRDDFLAMEVELGKYEWLDEEVSDIELEGEMGQRAYELFPWLKSRPVVVQGSVMSYLIRVGSNLPSLASKGVTLSESMTDEEIISYDIMSKIFNKDGDRAKCQSAIASAILNSEITDDEIETWVREGALEGHPEFGSR